jgi:hypothetical protein
MSEKFPYGYDVNAYIDKAFELSYHSRHDGTLKADKDRNVTEP